MTLKELFCRKRAAFLLSLAFHGLLFGVIVYYSLQESEPLDTPEAPSTMRIVAYTPTPQKAPEPIVKPQPKPKPKPKPKSKPKKIIEPKLKVPLQKIEKKEEPKPEPEPIVEPEIVEEQIEKPVELEPVEEMPPPPPQKTPEQLAQEQQIREAAELEEYVGVNFSSIRDMALKNLIYPRMAKKMGWSGVVEIKLIVDTNGKLVDASIFKSSGRELLDKSALKAALSLKDEVLPKPKSRSEIILPIAFRLR